MYMYQCNIIHMKYICIYGEWRWAWYAFCSASADLMCGDIRHSYMRTVWMLQHGHPGCLCCVAGIGSRGWWYKTQLHDISMDAAAQVSWMPMLCGVHWITCMVISDTVTWHQYRCCSTGVLIMRGGDKCFVGKGWVISRKNRAAMVKQTPISLENSSVFDWFIYVKSLGGIW